jgi:hypothetical protein
MTRRAVLLKALRAMPGDVVRTVNGRQAEDLGGDGNGDAETQAAILGRMIAFEKDYRNQLGRVFREEEPALRALVSDGPALDARSSVTTMIVQLKQAREETLAFLEALSLGDWQRKAVHETLGETSLRFLVQHLVDWDTHHLRELMGRRSVGAVPTSPLPSERRTNQRQDSEVKNERQRARKWPRRRIRRD